jgi:hypothetical protein
MAAVRVCGTVLLCVLVVEIAVLTAEVADGPATRTRGQGRTPNGRRRQQVSFFRDILSVFGFLNP